MANANKKKVAVSAGLIVASIALLAGLTFAWFTDSVTNKGNRIQAGTLDVQLWDGDAEITDSSDPVFDYAKWEPGYSDGANLKVVNAGNLALKYELRFRFGDMSASKGIEGVIDVIVDGEKVGTLADFVAKSDEPFDSGALQAHEESAQKAIVLKMQETAGSAVQGVEAVIDFDIVLVATQAASEEDGFGNDQYDVGAEFPVATNEDLREALASAKEGDVIALGAGAYTMPDIDVKGVSLVGEVDDAGNPASVVEFEKPSEGAAFDGLTVTADGVALSNLVFRAESGIGKENMVNLQGGDNLSVSNCDFVSTGTSCTALRLDGGAASVRGCSFTDGSRAIGWSYANGDVLIENCAFSGATYPIHFDGGDGKHTVTVRGCDIASPNWGVPFGVGTGTAILEGNRISAWVLVYGPTKVYSSGNTYLKTPDTNGGLVVFQNKDGGYFESTGDTWFEGPIDSRFYDARDYNATATIIFDGVEYTGFKS